MDPGLLLTSKQEYNFIKCRLTISPEDHAIKGLLVNSLYFQCKGHHSCPLSKRYIFTWWISLHYWYVAPTWSVSVISSSLLAPTWTWLSTPMTASTSELGVPWGNNDITFAFSSVDKLTVPWLQREETDAIFNYKELWLIKTTQHWLLKARLRYLYCVSNGITAV